MWKRCFSRTQFLITAIWEDSSPAIFSHYKANYSWMSRQFPDNHWCCGDRHWSLLLSFFFCWWQYISLCSWNLKYSSILSAGAYYSLPRSCRDSIPQSVCWTWHQQRVAHSQWAAAFSFLSSVFHSHVPLNNASFPLSMIEMIMETSCHTDYFCHILPPRGGSF